MLTSTPNLLTLGRVAMIPIVVALLYVEERWGRWAACLVFTIAATTDWVDGHLARKWQQQSLFGRWLDPIADKLLVGATLTMLVGFGRAPLLPSVVIMLREIMVSGLREYMAEVRVGMPVTRLAKWKTAVQMTAIGFLIVGEAGPSWLAVTWVGWVGLWVAAVLTLVTGWEYLQAGLAHMLAADQVPAAAAETKHVHHASL
ncbi:MAG: CDP-diacylglycerol--glycerol-3-phosphate 3-phosphatidyltransferase [Geminicoccaceae bacterium]